MTMREAVEKIERARVRLHDEADKHGMVERAADKLQAAVSFALSEANRLDAELAALEARNKSLVIEGNLLMRERAQLRDELAAAWRTFTFNDGDEEE